MDNKDSFPREIFIMTFCRNGLTMVRFAILGLIAFAPGRAVVAADDQKGDGKSATITAGEIKLTVPETWKKKAKSSSQFRVAEIEIPAAKDDKDNGELVVFYFGAGGAGGIDANVSRWIGQFEEEGRKVRSFAGKSEQGKYTLVDLSGTYNKPIGPPIQMKSEKKSDWRMIGVILETEQGPYFLKLDGPKKTITAIEADYRKSFGGDAKSETERQKE
jgi:hypothetical protein